ncbi:MAG: histidinol-phosphatase [Alphaproteobacteria bacterium]|nr:histidinol-phosphatase [Alphaproteobacteria bacterium]
MIDLANRLADAAGAVISRYFRADFHIENKQDASPVTVADREAEQAIRAILEKERPQDGIHGEEFGSDPGTSGYLWVLDPIDGTKAFATGRPLFGTLIGLIHEGTAVLGVMDQPINKERWLGAAGHGTTLNGKKIRVRDCPDIAQANISTTGPDMFDFEDYLRFYSFLKEEAGFTLYGGDCYSYGQLAGGWLDGVVEAYMKLHDYAALIPIVEQAGGVITNWQGKPLRTDASYEPEEVIACGDRRVHERLCAILSA